MLNNTNMNNRMQNDKLMKNQCKIYNRHLIQENIIMQDLRFLELQRKKSELEIIQVYIYT